MNELIGMILLAKKKPLQLLIIGLLSLLFPIYCVMVWIFTVEVATGQAERLNTFFNFFPAFLQNSFYLTCVAIIFCVLAAILSFYSLPANKKWIQLTSLIILVFSFLLILWFLFTLL